MGSDRVVNALKRLATEVSYMMEAPTQKLIVSAETQLALDEAVEALKEIGENLE